MYLLCAAEDAQHLRETRAAFEAEQCLICLEPPTDPTSLPCGHEFCTKCLAELRQKGVAEACPLCRAPLPHGKEKLMEAGHRIVERLRKKADPHRQGPWSPLAPTEQKELNGALTLLQEAADQGLFEAALVIAQMYSWGQGVQQDLQRVLEINLPFAEAGYANSQYEGEPQGCLNPAQRSTRPHPPLKQSAPCTSASLEKTTKRVVSGLRRQRHKTILGE